MTREHATTRRLLRVVTAATAATVSLAFGVIPAQAEEPTAGTLAGTVTTESDNAPVAGVEVYASTPDGERAGYAVTGEDGTYLMEDLAEGDYRVRFAPEDPDLVPEYFDGVYDAWDAQSVVVDAGGATTGIDASLTAYATISGTVTRESDGAPVAATVIAGLDVVTTDADGAYTARVLPGEYTVRFVPDDPALLEEYWNDARSDADAEAVTVTTGEHRTGVDAQVASAARISGTVHVGDAPGGDPSVETAVEAYAAGVFVGMAWADAAGAYSLYLPAGDYTLRASGGYTPLGILAPEYYREAATAADATVVTAATDAPRQGIDFTLEPGAGVTGTVTVDGDVPVEITAYRWSGSAWQTVTSVTGAPGAFDLSGSHEVPGGALPAGTYTFGVAAEGYCTSYYGGATSLDGARTVDLASATVTTGIDIRLRRSCDVVSVTPGIPTVIGEPRIGRVLAADAGQWGPEGVELTYQWLADGEPIAGAHGDTLRVTGTLRGARISVTVTGSLDGQVAVDATSVALEPAYAGPKKR